MDKFLSGVYSVAVVDKNTGEVKPLPHAQAVTLRTQKREDTTPISPPSTLGSMTFTAQTDGLFADYIERHFPAPKYEGVLHLCDDGKVIAYVGFEANGVKYSPRWYFVDVIDRGVWRYALREGLQLEDAVRELNRRWGKQA